MYLHLKPAFSLTALTIDISNMILFFYFEIWIHHNHYHYHYHHHSDLIETIIWQHHSTIFQADWRNFRKLLPTYRTHINRENFYSFVILLDNIVLPMTNLSNYNMLHQLSTTNLSYLYLQQMRICSNLLY